MGNIVVFIIYVSLFIWVSRIDCLIGAIWKKLIDRHKFSTEQKFHRELTELEQEAFQAYNALIRESMKAAEEDYYKRRKELTENEENNRKRSKNL